MFSPKSTEGEVPYTDRVVVPVVQGFIDDLGIPGLLVGGHHTGINRPIRYLGMDFHPDLVVVEGGRRLIALEVKFLGRSGRSGALTKALGQTFIYRNGGYATAAALVIDKANYITPSQLRLAREKSGTPETVATVLRKAGREMVRGNVLYPSTGIG